MAQTEAWLPVGIVVYFGCRDDCLKDCLEDFLIDLASLCALFVLVVILDLTLGAEYH